jgi:Trk-type K+ transport system membrane component
LRRDYSIAVCRKAHVIKATSVVALAFALIIIGVILLSALRVSGQFHPHTVEGLLCLQVVSALGTARLSTGHYHT